ncbi:MAG: VOC family protein [Gammaproteobacteria bacterium]|nr:VOC family protein [Gammaproteobacteria bacterium]NNM00776.1 VOC family protein [Gammaproteobacteria bacterium]
MAKPAAAHLHHVHLFSADCDATVAWWVETLGAEVAFDGVMGGSRNVFLRVGEGRLHLYDQRPRDTGKGAVHHIGIRVADLRRLHERLVARGVPLRSGVREFGSWRYIMCPAPDDVLLELFEIDTVNMEQELARYFGDSSDFRSAANDRG